MASFVVSQKGAAAGLSVIEHPTFDQLMAYDLLMHNERQRDLRKFGFENADSDLLKAI